MPGGLHLLLLGCVTIPGLHPCAAPDGSSWHRIRSLPDWWPRLGWEITGGIVPGMTVDFNRRRRLRHGLRFCLGVLDLCLWIIRMWTLGHRTFILWSYCLDSWAPNIEHLWCGKALWLSTSVLQRLWAQRLRSPVRAEFPSLNVLDFQGDSAAQKKPEKRRPLDFFDSPCGGL